MDSTQNFGPLLRINSVTTRTGLSKTEIYRRIKSGKFPSPLRLGPQSVAWPQSAVDSWIGSLVQQGVK